jgi:hypothetical protein
MKHHLSLFIAKDCDCATHKVLDSSVYAQGVDIANAILEVIPPGYTCPVIYEVGQNFNLTLNIANLEIMLPLNNYQLGNMPDGIYHYKYSVDPNVKTAVELDRLRTCKIRNKVKDAYLKLLLEKWKVNNNIFKEGLKKINYIEDLIKTAEFSAEDGQLKTAKVLYEEANNLVNDFNNCVGC